MKEKTMSKEFRPFGGPNSWVARWNHHGGFDLNTEGWSGIGPAQIPAFIEWLQAGPSKPRYRITSIFDRPPRYVGFRESVTTDISFLLDGEVEEVRD